MVGMHDLIVSPDSSSTRRRTPCVLGCCGPMLTVIVSVRNSVPVMTQPELSPLTTSNYKLQTTKMTKSRRGGTRFDDHSPDSTNSHTAWMRVRWTSWIRAVESE